MRLLVKVFANKVGRISGLQSALRWSAGYVSSQMMTFPKCHSGEVNDFGT